MNFSAITDKVTIRDILADANIEARGTRIACPIHGGDNPSSFSFKDHTFFCFKCGVKGGLLILAQELFGLTKCEAMKYLLKKAGIKDTDSVTIVKAPPKPKTFEELGLELIDMLRNFYTWMARIARQSSLGVRHSLSQYAEHAGEFWDERYIYHRYQIKYGGKE